MATGLPNLVTPLPGPKAKAVIERDARFISPSYTRSYPLVASRGEGAVVEDVDGNRFLDCSAGIAVVATGHCHPQVVEAIQKARPDARVVMLTGYGNIATAVAAVKAGAVDYLPKPADADDVLRALLARKDEAPAAPENPMSADRVRWEHIQRVYELCGHNVSETARRLNMHRRTLQRILAKRSPR